MRRTARVFIYMRQQLSVDQIRNAIESLPKRRPDGHGRGWIIGPSDAEAFVYRMDERQLDQHNADKMQVKRLLGLSTFLRRRMNTALVVYVEDRPPPLPADLVSPMQVLRDQTAIDRAQTLAHRLKSYGVVVLDNTENGGAISRVKPSDFTRV